MPKSIDFNQIDDDMDSIMEAIMLGEVNRHPERRRASPSIMSNRPLANTQKPASVLSNNDALYGNNRIRNNHTPTSISDKPERQMSNHVQKNNLPRVRSYSNFSKNIAAQDRYSSQSTSKNDDRLRQVKERGSSKEADTPEAVRHEEKVTSNRKTPRRLSLTAAYAVIPTLVISIAAITLKDPVLAVFKPKNPFSTQIISEIKIPLYYPTKLPGSFKMEINSITKPQDNVLIYAITNDTNDKINVSQQKQSEDINIDAIHSSYSNNRDIDTKFGKIKLGETKESTTVAHVLTGQTWVILTMNKGIVDDKEITTIVNNLSM